MYDHDCLTQKPQQNWNASDTTAVHTMINWLLSRINHDSLHAGNVVMAQSDSVMPDDHLIVLVKSLCALLQYIVILKSHDYLEIH